MPSVLKSLLVLLFCGFALSMTAQEVSNPTRNSPFSRFGIGDIEPLAYSAQLGMGGIGQAYNHSHIASPSNPAALGALRYTSYQVGVGVTRTSLEQGDEENDNVDGQLQNISLAFPLQNSLNEVLDGRDSKFRIGTQLAVAPYSNVGYNIQVASDEEGLGTVESNFEGSGGFYRLQFAGGVEYDRRARFGVNFTYVFGRTNTESLVRPTEVFGASTLTERNAFRGRGLETLLGGQYDFILEKNSDGITKRVLTVGATTTIGASFNGDASRSLISTNQFFLMDTLTFTVDEPQVIEFPNKFGLGAYYRVINKFAIGFDIERVSYGDFRNSLRPLEELTDATNVRAGVEWTPDSKAFGQYWKQVQYRAGGFLNQDPRPGVDNERGFTFGLGLPIVRPREEVSYVNLSLNAGYLDTSSDITQRYVRLVAGFTLTDNTWFFKRRFN